MECKLENITLYYEEYGKGKPIIMIHGFYPDHRLMSGCMEPIFINRQGYRRIYLDLPGMGRTKGEAWINNSDKMLDVIFNFIDEVIPGQNFLLAGESYGGYLSRGVVYREADRVDGLLLLCPAIIADFSKRNLPSRTVLVRDNALLSRLDKKDAEGFETIAVVQNEEIWQRYNDEVYSGVKIADAGFLEKLRKEGYPLSFNPDALIKKFGKPTLFILGKQDDSVGYKDAWDILDNYPRGTFTVLDRAGHNLQIEQAGVFNCLVNEWIDRVEEENS